MINRLKSWKQFLLKKVTVGDQRSVLLKKNILGSFLVKFFDVILEFALVPVSLAYLTQTDYGIWLTIYSMVNWLNFFDAGLSHGLRNQLAIALSNKDFTSAKKLTSTTYLTIGLISTIIAITGVIIVPHIDWTMVLSVDGDSSRYLGSIISIVVLSFSIQLSFRIITSVYAANQMPFWTYVTFTIAKFAVLIGLLILFSFSEKNLLYFAFVYSFAPVIVLICFSIVFFSGKYRKYRPSLSHLDFSKINSLMGLGLKFFVIQISATVLFMSDNLIISHILDPSYVAPYQITHKYFGITLIVFSIIVAPYWSAITDAYNKGELIWIKRAMNNLVKLWIIALIGTVLLMIFFYPFLGFWVGDEIEVPLLLAILWAAFVGIQSLNLIYTHFLNGTGKVLLQMVSGIFTIIINIPLSIFLARNLEMGTSGVILATNISLALYVVLRKIQYNKIVNERALGLWKR